MGLPAADWPVVEDWWRCFRLLAGTRDQRKSLESGEDQAAVAAVLRAESIVETGGPESVRLIEELLQQSCGSADNALVGAGPLEDLLLLHGEKLAADVEAVASRSPRFAEALGSVWLPDASADAVRSLVKRHRVR